MRLTSAIAIGLVFFSKVSSASAQTPPPVPEIDAFSGISAIAIVGATVALIRELRNRS